MDDNQSRKIGVKGFEYNAMHWKSLTAIAKAITGAHWNGPLFFGLTGRKA